MNLFFFDTETTSLEEGRLVQLAYKKRGEAETSVEYFKPPVPIEFEAMGVHHITEKKVAGKPAFKESDCYKTFSEMLNEWVPVAHNAKYDISILKNEGIEVKSYICTLKVANTLYDLPNYKLQSLRYRWGIDIDEAIAHDAKGDVMVLEQVFEYMLKDYCDKNGVGEDEAIKKFISISCNPMLLKKLTFGKYAGLTFEELKKQDPGYLEWLGKLQDKDEDFVYTVQKYLETEEGDDDSAAF